MVYRKTLMTWLNGGYFRRICPACGYKDPKRVKLVKNSCRSMSSPNALAAKAQNGASSSLLAMALVPADDEGRYHERQKTG